MTYATSGLIQAADYNGFASTNTPNVNAVWSTGSGNRGYGQPAIVLVNPGQVITAAQFATLLGNITTSANHQGTTLGSFRNGSPSPGQVILYEPNLASNISLIDTNRLNAAAQGSTSSSVATSAVTWYNTLTFTFTITFASSNNARYWFNAGGQLGLNFSHPIGPAVNSTIHFLCADTGTVWLSSPTGGIATLSGIPYNGVTKVGGANPGASSVSTNTGFYALTDSPQQIFRQDASTGYYYYATTYLRITATHNGAGVITFTCLIDDTGGGGYYYYSAITPGTQATLILRPPSTTYLANTWGTPAVSSTVVAT